MYIEDLERVTMLRNHRLRAIELRDAANSGSLGDFKIWHEGNQRDVWSVICADPIRSAVVAECERAIAEKDAELGALGVNVACKLIRAALPATDH